MDTKTMNWGSAKAEKSVNTPPRGILIGFVVIALSAALLGGSSRYDNGQLIILQPVAWLVAGYFLIRFRRSDLAGAKWPAYLLAGLTLTMIIQLIPLPAVLWTHLPGREIVRDLDAALRTNPMRPMSLVPTRTMNALANLSVPIAGLLAFLALRAHRIKIGTYALLAIGAANALAALIQFVGPGGEWLYFYHGKNGGAAVGLFANPNHASVFGAVMMVFIACTISMLDKIKSRGQILILYGLYALIFLMSLTSGSRAGLLTCILALAATAIIMFKPTHSSQTVSARPRRKFSAAGWITAASGIAIAAIFVLSDRLPAFDEFVADDPLGDIRFAFMPILIEMAETYFPFGSGFGSLENVYYIHEPDALLQPAYLNMAHNDWVQIIIEGGIAGAALLIGTLFWIGKTGLQLFWRNQTGPAIALIAGFAIIALASYFDYPLRTPLFQLAALWWLLMANAVVQNAVPARGDNGVSFEAVAR